MLKLIAACRVSLDEISADLDLEINRKKSAQMIMASHLAATLAPQMHGPVDVIFCTGEGEIQQTFEFFRNLAEGRARPILFQNSLHNSTLGSLSLEVPEIHTGITTSNGDLSFEMGIDIALASRSPRAILIIGVDAYNPETQRIRQESYGDTVELSSGGCAGLFLPPTHLDFLRAPGPVITDICIEETTESKLHQNFYPSNGLEDLLAALETGQKSLSLLKPNHRLVRVSLQ